MYAFDQDYQWYDEKNIAKFVKKGYLEIDILLMNAAINRNNGEVFKLLAFIRIFFYPSHFFLFRVNEAESLKLHQENVNLRYLLLSLSL